MNASVPSGLSESEVRQRIAEDGYNELPGSKSRNILTIAWNVVKEPMFLLLVICGGIYLVLGEMSDAIMLMAFVFVIMGITFYQERKTERALEALRDLSSPRALVIRDGVEKRIAGREVVRGDILVLAEGDRVPADALLFQSSYFSVDESLLTGESVPVRKVPSEDVPDMGPSGGDNTPWLFSGTLVVKGKGFARVIHTGLHTEMGKIGKALQEIDSKETPLHRQTGRLVRNFALTGAIICVLVIGLYTVTRGNLLEGILAGIALAMAMIPEEFPVVLSIFLALGAWRIAQKNVLTRRVPAVEALGAATVLCVDKTGTLTQNRMSVCRVASGGAIYSIQAEDAPELPEAVHETIEFGILASHVDPFDPMEKTFRELGKRYLEDTEHWHYDWALEHEYPLSDGILAMSHVWRRRDNNARVIAAKGAPEAVMDLCHLDVQAQVRVSAEVDALASEGLRVLGVARADVEEGPLPPTQHDFHFRFLGLAGFSDPIRPAVPHAIQECENAGIRVVMITGDYAATARNIASQISMPLSGGILTGPELDAMDEAELARRVRNTNVFARVVPEQKLRIVNAFKRDSEVVAMTGDGVNDAPALKSADIGVAMGGRGTDVAREAASLVLLDDDFSSIVQAVRVGRRIFDNLKKAIGFILAVHVPIAGLSLIPVVLQWPLILLPVHIVFLEMVIDPACTIVFEVEPEERNVMCRPPRNRKEPLLGRPALWQSLCQGLGVLIITLALFALFRGRGLSDDDARTVAFSSLLLGNLALIVSNRSWSMGFLSILRVRNAAMWWVIGSAIAFLMAVIYIAPLRSVFHFSPLHGMDLIIIAGAGALMLVWLELAKKFWGRTTARA